MGNEAKVAWARPWSPVINSVLRPEEFPGQTATQPAIAKLKKILLQPGAIHELPSPGTIRWLLPETAKEESKNPGKDPAARIFATLSGTSSNLSEGRHEAMITWHLNCTNGTEWDESLRKPLWPARGGWSGSLETGPLRTTLYPR